LCAGQYGRQEIEYASTKKMLKNPNEILLYACALLCYWAGLYPEDTQRMINSREVIMMKMTLKLLGKNNEDNQVKSLTGVPDQGDEDGDDLKGTSQEET
jgi:hypothetical protein